jgi:predicted transcriptional regulator of viral defense system
MNRKTRISCFSIQIFSIFASDMITKLSDLGNIPVSTATIASLFPDRKAGVQKVRSLELASQIIRLKKGLYVVSPEVSHTTLSTELIANHLYAPSYLSMSTALRYYGLIPEAVYLNQSMTTKHSRKFHTPIGDFSYTSMNREAFPIGITIINKQSYAFTMATPEKALCDLIANSPKVNLRYRKDVEIYLEEDIRMELEDFRNMDTAIFEEYIKVGKKAGSIQTLLNYLSK